MEHNRIYGGLYDEGRKEEAKVVHAEYLRRTREMALALGEESIAGKFLIEHFPLPQE